MTKEELIAEKARLIKLLKTVELEIKENSKEMARLSGFKIKLYSYPKKKRKK